MEHPEKEEYANFTIRVSGYAVKFIDLTREQQMDVIARTCHEGCGLSIGDVVKLNFTMSPIDDSPVPFANSPVPLEKCTNRE